MRILIVYGTTDGHTRHLARFMAHRLQGAGNDVALFDAVEEGLPDPKSFDAALIAASLHMGHFQSAVVHFARRHHEALNAMQSAFVCVSLSAAGDDPEDWAGLKQCVDRFEAATLWKPRAIHHAEGAILFTAYDFFRKLAMREIARKRGQPVTTDGDYDYTDYEALGRFVDDFVAGKAPAAAA
jgi:menaquinone-dependent protoporphyrinogen oxidase